MSTPRVFARLCSSDLRYGLASVAPRLVVVAGAAALAFFLSYVDVGVYLPNREGPLTFGETLLCVWCGMLPYDPTVSQPFDFPTAWLALIIIILYVGLDYPFRNLGGMGAHMIVAAHSRWAWWLAKCSWVAVCALVCWLVSLAVCAAITVASGGPWDLAVRAGVAVVMGAGQNDATSLIAPSIPADGGASATAAAADINIAPAMLTLLLALVAVMLVQTAVSLLTHPVVGLIAGIAVPFVSFFFAVWWLPGNYLMLARTDVLLDAGMRPDVGALLSLAVCIVCVTLGGAVFCNKDLMGREADAS